MQLLMTLAAQGVDLGKVEPGIFMQPMLGGNWPRWENNGQRGCHGEPIATVPVGGHPSRPVWFCFAR
jgi:hypothetical protein